MKVVLQRSGNASVTVDGDVTGAIRKGYVLLVGITHDDTEQDAEYIAKKIAGLRLCEDEEGKMNRTIDVVAGESRWVRQFTSNGDVRKGRGPSFIEAARPEKAEPVWSYFNEAVREQGWTAETRAFGAMTDASLVNDGPVTTIIEST